MTASPNPFADEPPPAAAIRLQSANPENPYAAPTDVWAKDAAPVIPGEGLWNDRGMLVVQAGALFPPRCILTNEPTQLTRSQALRWSTAVEWSEPPLELTFGISEATEQRLVRTQRLCATTAIGASIVFLVMLALLSTALACLAGFLSLICVGTIFVAVHFARGQEFLAIDRVQGTTYWLRGAGEPFLRSLPRWPA